MKLAIMGKMNYIKFAKNARNDYGNCMASALTYYCHEYYYKFFLIHSLFDCTCIGFPDAEWISGAPFISASNHHRCAVSPFGHFRKTMYVSKYHVCFVRNTMFAMFFR
jgi:hypothetical protein